MIARHTDQARKGTIVIFESTVDERRRSALYNTVLSLDGLKEELDKQLYLKRTTLYYKYQNTEILL